MSSRRGVSENAMEAASKAICNRDNMELWSPTTRGMNDEGFCRTSHGTGMNDEDCYSKSMLSCLIAYNYRDQVHFGYVGMFEMIEQQFHIGNVLGRYPEAEKYRKKPLPHAQELYNLFESTLSNGESKLTPAADGMPTDSDATSQTINIGELKDCPTDEDDSYWNEIKFSNNTPIGEQVDKLIAKSKEKKRKIISSTSDPDVKEVVELIKGQLKSTNAQREALLAEKVAEKAEMDNYSTMFRDS
ncbi:hypothetical protein IFM89_016596 [Coptis chinensis]|uniref:Uncharacterized protein n=1 Tax=Coptis chinensis TaxID=261450 RepID=A0A835IWF4_9MAGN|nr:hypothetical protein IFM89_016596 [Coptis chinensis]